MKPSLKFNVLCFLILSAVHTHTQFAAASPVAKASRPISSSRPRPGSSANAQKRNEHTIANCHIEPATDIVIYYHDLSVGNDSETTAVEFDHGKPVARYLASAPFLDRGWQMTSTRSDFIALEDHESKSVSFLIFTRPPGPAFGAGDLFGVASGEEVEAIVKMNELKFLSAYGVTRENLLFVKSSEARYAWCIRPDVELSESLDSNLTELFTTVAQYSYVEDSTLVKLVTYAHALKNSAARDALINSIDLYRRLKKHIQVR